MDKSVEVLLKKLDSISARLDTIESKIASGASAAPAASSAAAAAPAEVGAAQAEFEELIKEKLIPLVDLCTFSDIVKGQMQQLVSIAQDIAALIGMASRSKKPTPEVMGKILAPISEKMCAVSSAKDANRADKFFNNISACSEIVQAFAWVSPDVEPKPAPFVGETIPSAEFYTNRVLRDAKGKDETQCNWAKGLIAFFKEMQLYIKKVHTTGLVWNPKGGDAAPLSASAAPAPAAASPAAPPPPNMAEILAPADSGAKKDDSGNGRAALFASLNKGGLTSGLKHVKDEEKNKNMSLEERKALAAAASANKKPAAAKPAAPRNQNKPKGPASLSLKGAKWLVENQFQAQGLSITETERTQTVYVSTCMQSGLIVKGKINALTIDGCSKCCFQVDDVVSSIEIINSKDIKLQITGASRSCIIDKCDGVQVFITKECAENIQITTCKTSSICISVPGATEEDDSVEHPIPEQFISKFENNKLVTAHSSTVE